MVACMHVICIVDFSVYVCVLLCNLYCASEGIVYCVDVLMLSTI